MNDSSELLRAENTSSSIINFLAMTHYERMDLEDRGGDDKEYPRFTEEQFFEMAMGI